MFAYQSSRLLSDYKYFCLHKFCPSPKNKVCKSPCFGDRENVAISVAWGTRLLYFITALSASLDAYKTQSGSCCISSYTSFNSQYFIHCSKHNYRVIWQAVGLPRPHLIHVCVPSGQIWIEWTAGGWTGQMRLSQSWTKLPTLRGL